MKILPLQDRILIRRAPEEEKTKGGLFIPSTAQEKSLEAEVIAVGPGRFLKDGAIRPLDVKAGDRVLISKWTGQEVKIEGEEHLIVREDELLGIIQR
jgi:chaperonin GroES